MLTDSVLEELKALQDGLSGADPWKDGYRAALGQAFEVLAPLLPSGWIVIGGPGEPIRLIRMPVD